MYVARMTDDQVIAVLTAYENKLVNESRLVAQRASSEVRWPGEGRAQAHALWMCSEAKKYVQAGERDKAMRWLGFIQGVMWSSGVYTIEEMKGHNR